MFEECYFVSSTKKLIIKSPSPHSSDTFQKEIINAPIYVFHGIKIFVMTCMNQLFSNLYIACSLEKLHLQTLFLFLIHLLVGYKKMKC